MNIEENKQELRPLTQKEIDYLNRPTLFMGTYGTYLKSYIKLEKKIKKFFSKFNN